MAEARLVEMRQERSVWREYAEALIIAAVFLLFTNTFVVQTFYIPSGSMEDTLLIGDHLFVNRFIYGPTPTGAEKGLLPFRPVHRGDIVVFRTPPNVTCPGPSDVFVKRLIGLPGDTVEIRDDQLYVNGEPVPEPYVNGGAVGEPFGPVTVGEGEYFMMGDNRLSSCDSREWGTVPRENLIGPVFARYWPVQRIGFQ